MNPNDTVHEPTLSDVFQEVRALRQDVAAFLPTESIHDYEEPERLMGAYERAAAQYPPQM